MRSHLFLVGFLSMAVSLTAQAGTVCADFDTKPILSSMPGNLLTTDPECWLPQNARQGGILRLHLESSPKSFNYLLENTVDVSNIQALNMTPLVVRHQKELSKYGPALATFLGRSDDYLTYTYELRPDIFWHEPIWIGQEQNAGRSWLARGQSCIDVGRRTAQTLKATRSEMASLPLAADRHWIEGRCRVTAHDVIFWLRMLMNPQVERAASLRSYFKDLDVDGVKILDDFRFQIRWKSKRYKNELMAKWLGSLPEHLYAYGGDGERLPEALIGTQLEHHWYNPRGLGNGPYRMTKFDSDVVELKRDLKYPMGGNALDEIHFKVVRESSRIPRLLLESAHASSEKTNTGVHAAPVRSQNLKTMRERGSQAIRQGRIQEGFFWSFGYSYIGWNAETPFFSDRRVRRAMSHALKADEILKEIRFGLGRRTTGPIPPNLPHYDEALPPIPYDLDMARTFLKEAGWADTDGDGILDKEIDGQRVKFEFTFMIVSKPAHQVTAAVLKESLKEIGVKCNLKSMEWVNFLKALHAKEFDAVMLGWGTSPDVDFDQIWHSRHADNPKSSNFVGFRNAKADRIIEDMEFEFDMDKRQALARRFHKIIYDEQPYTFLFQLKTPYFWTNKLQNGQTIGRTRPYLNPRRWFLKQ